MPTTLIFVAPKTHQPYFHLRTFAFIPTTWNTLLQITTWLTLSSLLASAQISAYHSDSSFSPYQKQPPPQPLPWFFCIALTTPQLAYQASWPQGLLLLLYPSRISVWHSSICWMNKSNMSLLPKTKFLLSILDRRNRFYVPRLELLQGIAREGKRSLGKACLFKQKVWQQAVNSRNTKNEAS